MIGKSRVVDHIVPIDAYVERFFQGRANISKPGLQVFHRNHLIRLKMDFAASKIHPKELKENKTPVDWVVVLLDGHAYEVVGYFGDIRC